VQVTKFSSASGISKELEICFENRVRVPCLVIAWLTVMCNAGSNPTMGRHCHVRPWAAVPIVSALYETLHEYQLLG